MASPQDREEEIILFGFLHPGFSLFDPGFAHCLRPGILFRTFKNDRHSTNKTKPMGSFSYLTVDDYPIYSVKNGYAENAAKLLFQVGDFILEKRLRKTRNALFWGDAYKKNRGTFRFFGFQQTANNCLRRLEIYGMSMKKAKSDFMRARKAAQKEGYIYEFAIDRVAFETYLAEVKYILNNKLREYDKLHTNLRESLIADELGIFGQSEAACLYCILSVLPPDALVEFDLTDVIAGGWVKESDVRHIPTEKIIVLTEGKTDVEFIRGAMQRLYPHLLPYYHFIDFNEHKVESNASALAKLVTQFAAANVSHHMVALFDNDTVGIMEMKRIDQSKLPKTMKVIRLPDIDLAKKYPTIGPTGPKKMNVNGLACGIEMYTGVDVLQEANVLTPVLWKGYIDKASRYQGELDGKGLIQERFRAKLKNGSESHLTDMNLILQCIFTAFT